MFFGFIVGVVVGVVFSAQIKAQASRVWKLIKKDQ